MIRSSSVDTMARRRGETSALDYRKANVFARPEGSTYPNRTSRELKRGGSYDSPKDCPFFSETPLGRTGTGLEPDPARVPLVGGGGNPARDGPGDGLPDARRPGNPCDRQRSPLLPPVRLDPRELRARVRGRRPGRRQAERRLRTAAVLPLGMRPVHRGV